jgi:hypothetical protein
MRKRMTDKEFDAMAIAHLMETFKNKRIDWSLAFEINERIKDGANKSLLIRFIFLNVIIIYLLIFFK